MLPLKSHPKWKQLVCGDILPNFSTIAGNMMLSRLARSIKRDNSPANIDKCIYEAREFFERFEGIYGEELKRLF